MAILADNPDYELDLYPHLTKLRREFLLDVVEWLEKYKRPDLRLWLHLSIAAGLLGVDEKTSHAATSKINSEKAIKLNTNEERQFEIQRVAEALLQVAQSPCRIDATEFFFHTLDSNKRYELRFVSFPDDYLETIVLLKYYEKLLEKYPKLSIDMVPRSTRCSNDATYQDIKELLEAYPNLKKEKRFQIYPQGPKIGGVNLTKLHPEILRLIDRAFALDVRGARNYEMMQGINKETYFGFMVCREISESVTGLLSDNLPFIYLRQPPGAFSFRGFKNRYMNVKNGKMFADETVNDNKPKWEGGPIANFCNWSPERKKRFNVLRDFYSDNAPEFHWKFGDHLEEEVKEFLNKFMGKVLVIGCGSGKEVMYLIKRGCDAYGIDFSSEAILLARSNYPSYKNHFQLEDFYNIDMIHREQFDGIVANAALVHLLERDDLYQIFEKVYRRLNNNGLFFARVLEKEGKAEEFDDHLFGGLRWFVYFSMEELIRASAEAKFSVVEKIAKLHVKYSNVKWNMILLRK